MKNDEIPSIEDLKKIQADNNLLDVHVVYLGENRFVIAHTDGERQSGMDLEDCEIHQALLDSDPPQEEMLGFWVVSEAGGCCWERLTDLPGTAKI